MVDDRRAGAEFGWIILALMACAAGFWLIVSSAGRLASLVTGHGYRGPTVRNGDNVRAMLSGGPGSLWPDVADALVNGFIVAHFVLLIGLFVGGVGWWSRRRRVVGLDGRKAPKSMTTGGRIEFLRPGLNVKTATPADLGLALGNVGRKVVRATFEDTVLAVMAPRAGKTTAMAIPAILDAPGPVIVTSNKNDLVATTQRWRCRNRGRVWIFDPQDIGGHLPAWTWDPLASRSLL